MRLDEPHLRHNLSNLCHLLHYVCAMSLDMRLSHVEMCNDLLEERSSLVAKMGRGLPSLGQTVKSYFIQSKISLDDFVLI
jgi:hypothetical protein